MKHLFGFDFPRVKDFAKVLSEKLGISEAVLNKTLWGDFYLNTKMKRIMRGAQEKAKKPLFVQMVLENLWSVYENIAVRKVRFIGRDDCTGYGVSKILY